MQALFSDALRVAAVLGAAWVVMFATRTRSASLRRVVLVAALAAALVVPLLSQAQNLTRAAGLGEFRFDFALPRLDVGPDGGRELRSGATSSALPESARAPVSPAGASWSRFLPWIAGLVWLAGAFVVAARLFTAWLALRRLLRAARVPERRPAALSRAQALIGARARLLESDEVGVPLTAGVLRPVILVPADAAHWTDQRWDVVLRHELSHVRQRDVLAQRAAELVCVLHWFNPLAWWVRRRLEIERELAADERVVQSGLLASSYAGELVRVAAEHEACPLVARGALAAARRNGLSERVERLVARGPRPLPSRASLCAVLVAAVVFATFVACASVSESAPPAKPAAAAPASTLAEMAARELGTPASGVTLTIEPRIQAIAEAETAREIARPGARAATVIVIEPSSGYVLALTNPRAASASHAPGSTLKPLIVAAALDEDKLVLEQRFDCGAGFREYADGRRLRDVGAYGVLDVRHVLLHSSNVGASRIYDLLGGAAFTRWFARFHLEQPAPVQLPERAAGFAGGVASEPSGSLRGAVAALGAGVATSPLQIAAAYAALANDGVYLAPTLVRRASDAGGGVVFEHRIEPERVLRAETARAITKLLTAVVEDPQATGRSARVPGVSVAGKTGSAQLQPEGESPSYVSFVGIVPADRPRYVILVGVEHADPEASGGKIAAPVFARLAEQMLAQP